jgi:hypothetical protein
LVSKGGKAIDEKINHYLARALAQVLSGGSFDLFQDRELSGQRLQGVSV